MGQRARDCAKQLSEAEQDSLRKIFQRKSGHGIPTDHLEKLLTLGLAELSWGDVGPTGAARSALAAVA